MEGDLTSQISIDYWVYGDVVHCIPGIAYLYKNVHNESSAFDRNPFHTCLLTSTISSSSGL